MKLLKAVSSLDGSANPRDLVTHPRVMMTFIPSVRISGLNVSRMDLATLAKKICHDAEYENGFSVFTLNLDHIAKLRRNRAFKEAYGKARFISADGFPIAIAGLLKGRPLRRVAGSDLIEPLCAQAADRGLPVFFLGSTDDVLLTAIARLKEKHPRLVVAGHYAPPLGFDPMSPAADDVADMVSKSGAAICFVALGAPKQEFFADRSVSSGTGVAMICIGAGLDFIAGSQKRAPLALQHIGAEWLWRLAGNPRRLAARYLWCLTILPVFLLEETLGSSARRGSP